MEARPVDRVLHLEPPVQDAREHADERRAQSRPAGRAERELEAVLVEGERGGHHALHPRPRHERAPDEVCLAEHAVQVQVEARHPVA